ncbi:MAG: protein kinase [Polyangiaceae bacterium]|nr:protein kinase [Polyangiaceae bacterium]
MKEGDLVAGRYKLLRPIGGGAMGAVWAARHELLGRYFALKFARAPVKTDPPARARFQREAQLVGKLRHPNIVDVTDFGEVSPDGDFFLAMELLEGETLAERIEHRGPIESYEAVAIAADVARGLSAVHAVGIVHRDVKPENIFLARSPTGSTIPKLLDFGISKEQHDSLATHQGALTGTPAYMSPEQANGDTNLDPRTDIWSLGVVLYEMLTGKHPFVEQNYPSLMVAIAERPHEPLERAVPDAIRRIVDTCLAKRPSDRYSSSDALLDALVSVGNAGAKHSPGDRGSSRRNARWLIAGSVLASFIVVVVAMWIRRASDVPSGTRPPSSASAAAESAVHVPASSSTHPVADVVPASSMTQASPSSMAPAPSTTPQKAPRAPVKRPSTSVTTPGF